MYNGHKNRNHWNVALWIGNDYGMYQAARECLRLNPKNRDAAARELLGMLPERTPDGAPFTFSSVRAALVGMEG